MINVVLKRSILAVILLIAPLYAVEPEPTPTKAKKPESMVRTCKKELLKGFIAGAIATLGVDIVRDYILPNVDSLKLYDNYGICRDRLTGEATVVAATLGVSAVDASRDDKEKLSLGKLSARLAGVISGALCAKIVKKVTLKK